MSDTELSSSEMEEILIYISQQAEKLAGITIQSSLDKYGMGNNMVGLSVSTDILAQATGRVASVLATLTGQHEMIVSRITITVNEHMTAFDNFVKEQVAQNVAVEKE